MKNKSTYNNTVHNTANTLVCTIISTSYIITLSSVVLTRMSLFNHHYCYDLNIYHGD